MTHLVVYGGQYGSEGKASATEFWANKLVQTGKRRLTVIGENSPNSGHTCSRGATKNIPAASFWADRVFLGPDAVVDPPVLIDDWHKTGRPHLYIHEHAALLNEKCKKAELDLVKRVSSTGSGSGKARQDKFIDRKTKAVVRGFQFPKGIKVLSNDEYLNMARTFYNDFCLFECSQGTLLDTNFGLYPYVTSRSTLPHVAIARNGVAWLPWKFCGVYRTHPIRTGGPSGPTGAPELSWETIGVQPEIATVTKRVRRVFDFSPEDFCRSLQLAMPDIVMFTFLDYLGIDDLNGDLSEFQEWLEFQEMDEVAHRMPTWVSNTTGKFVPYERRRNSGDVHALRAVYEGANSGA
jgi:adenylosuccinate synthase